MSRVTDERAAEIRASIDRATARHAACQPGCATVIETGVTFADLADLLAERELLLAVYRWADFAIDVLRQDSDSDLDEWFICRGIAAVRAYRAASTGEAGR